MRGIAEGTYAVKFSDQLSLSERVRGPAIGVGVGGMDDARFVHLIDDDGPVTFHATYTAYNGSHASRQLLETKDFQASASRLSSDALPPIRVWRCLVAGFTVASPPCRSQTANPHARLLRSSVRLDERASLPDAHPSLGDDTARELRPAH